MKNYYAMLEVPIGCSPEEIRQAYRRLVQEHLDDAAVFADLREAYEVLSVPARRAEYDQAVWGETFDSHPAAASAVSGLVQAGRCPMGAESQCPVLLGRTSISETYCPECGYALAGLNPSATFETEPPTAKYPRLEDREGKTHPLRPGSNSVGREGGDVLVPDKTVSRSHARLEVADDGTVSVEDLGSTNGTRVNEETLTPQVPRVLAGGDSLRFGSVYFTLHLPAPEAGDAPAFQSAAPAEAASPSEAALSEHARAQLADNRDGETAVYPLMPGLTTFGRRPENTVVISGDLYVSGSHAQISAAGDVFVLTDIGSTNGTLLNGERIPINTPFTLSDGDEILIGGTALRFERLEPAPAPQEVIEEVTASEEVTEAEPGTVPLEAKAEAGMESVSEHTESSPGHAEG